MTRFHVPTRFLAGLAAASMAFAVAFGAAASLGLTVDTLAADQVAISACDSVVDSSYTTQYDVTVGAYTIDVVTLSNIMAACNGFDFKVTLADGSNVSLGFSENMNASLTGTLDARETTFDFTSQDVVASDVELIAVSISE